MHLRVFWLAKDRPLLIQRDLAYPNECVAQSENPG
jgi:hypothetical protein